MVLKPFRPSALWQALTTHLGARFVERVAPEPPADETPMAPSLDHLPAEWRRELHEAAERGDVQAALTLVDGIAPRDAATAQALRALLKAYRLETVRDLSGPRAETS